MRTALLLTALAVGAIGTVLIVSAGGDAGATDASRAAADTAGCGTVEWDRYDAGPAVEGIARMKTARECEPDLGRPVGAPPTGVDMVVTFYGTCEPDGSDGGCAPPVQVQSWPACRANLALYHKYPAPDGSTVEYTRTRIRGVPAATFDAGRRIEIYTGDATVIVFGENRGLARAAANRLTGVHGNRVVQASDQLPPPVDGALAGELTC